MVSWSQLHEVNFPAKRDLWEFITKVHCFTHLGNISMILWGCKDNLGLLKKLKLHANLSVESNAVGGLVAQ
jgi:hypothetical protein